MNVNYMKEPFLELEVSNIICMRDEAQLLVSTCVLVN